MMNEFSCFIIEIRVNYYHCYRFSLFLRLLSLQQSFISFSHQDSSLSLKIQNKPGTAQVGFISKAQKSSRNNNWKNLGKIHFFSKKYLVKKKSQIAEKPKKRPFRLIKRFFTNRKLHKKFKGVPFDRIQKYSEKHRIVPKKPQRGDL